MAALHLGIAVSETLYIGTSTWNGAILNVISYTCDFPVITSQNILVSSVILTELEQQEFCLLFHVSIALFHYCVPLSQCASEPKQLNGIHPLLILLFTPVLFLTVTCQNVLRGVGLC